MKSILLLVTSLFLFSCATNSNSSRAVKDAEELMSKGQTVEANTVLNNACYQQDLGACVYMARVSEVIKDEESAKKYYELACNANSGHSCHRRGSFDLSAGKNDIEHAKFFFIKGCNLNDSLSCYLLGDLAYEFKNSLDAKLYFKKSCDLGIKLGCEKLPEVENYRVRTPEQKISDNLLAMCQSGKDDACKTAQIKRAN